jgi:hypothetical protein
MDFEQYNRMIKAINDQLEAIADATRNQALTGCANEDNPMFKAAMHQHKRLTDAAARLNDQALAALGVSK